MNPIHRFFIVVEGENEAYPNYESAKVTFTASDPAEVNFPNSFICSPIFSASEDGETVVPELKDNTFITFLMVPNVFPSFQEVIQETEYGSGQVWFSLGLANLIIIEHGSTEISDTIIEKLTANKKLTAYERWELVNQKIKKRTAPVFKIIATYSGNYYSNIKISDKLPLYLKFALSEYIISVNKFLTASKKFTPQYYSGHVKTVEACDDLVNDLNFLYGDNDFAPSISLVKNLNPSGDKDIKTIISDGIRKDVVDELINDRHGRVIQFNSSMSYIYSQAYSGTFPIFDHIGIVRRHSLLGIGTAISALQELLIQMETALWTLPFEDLFSTAYMTEKCPDDFMKSLINPGYFEPEIWKNDSVRKTVIDGAKFKELPENFYNRLSFFSGRLGFREYEFSATAAIQVLVESNSLKWHIINYTHEIIHNHVRLILSHFITIPTSKRQDTYEGWMDQFRVKLSRIFDNYKNHIPNNDLTYYEYFVITVVKFVLNAGFYGSLGVPYDRKRLFELIGEPDKTFDLILPPSLDIRELIRNLNKDITEIFVHVIDFSYIYNRDIETYMRSIWASWSTVPAVSDDLKQYISRSLVIVGLNIEGVSSSRYSRVKMIFKVLIEKLLKASPNEIIFEKIIALLDSEEDDIDLKNRFYNCIILGDLVYNFFVGKLENHLDNDDKNRLTKEDSIESGEIISYAIETNSFKGEEIKSKVRFLLDQLGRKISKENLNKTDEHLEKTSAWLLLSLSSYTHE